LALHCPERHARRSIRSVLAIEPSTIALAPEENMSHRLSARYRPTRRSLLRTAGATALGAAGGALKLGAASASTNFAVLGPTLPDPAPPGYAPYGGETFTAWQVRNDATVNYEPIDWPRLHDRLVVDLEDDDSNYDVIYLAGWAQEFHAGLEPLDSRLPNALKADISPSSFATHVWNGQTYACPTTLSLLTLYGNTELLDAAGITKLPATWDELKGIAAELTRDGRFGWGINYGTPSGIGGAASYWMAFLQQAGGAMYGADGAPIFNDAPGVDALQLMIDLLPATHPSSHTDMAVTDATNRFIAGETAMMMNWPFMWRTLRTAMPDRVATAILPAGPAGSASIDGADAWAITASCEHPELAMKLIELYADKSIQRQQALETDWLPIRRSVLEEDEIQEALPHAATVLEQSRHPFSSFLTPDYGQITTALGREIQSALNGAKTASQALTDAAGSVAAIIKQRETQEEPR
jgi:multiple sugar transport system substrate-binding protein